MTLVLSMVLVAHQGQTSNQPHAAQHHSTSGLTDDSKDVCSLVLPPMAAKAGLVQELNAQDPWYTALCQTGTAMHQWCIPSTF